VGGEKKKKKKKKKKKAEGEFRTNHGPKPAATKKEKNEKGSCRYAKKVIRGGALPLEEIL